MKNAGNHDARDRRPGTALADNDIVLPHFAASTTFLRAPHALREDVHAGAIAVYGIPTDATCASRPGARWGPNAIRMASAELDYFLRSSVGQELVDIDTGLGFKYSDADSPLVDCGDLMTFPLDPERTVDVVSAEVAQLVERQALPVGLGGDHFVTFAICKGVADGLRTGNPNAKVGYIHIDADLDMSADNPTWGPLFHGTNARLVAGLPAFDTRNMVMFGTSGFTRRDQWEFVHDSGMTMITLSEIREQGIASTIRRAIDAALDGVDAVYVSCDIDVIDGAFAPGTGGFTFSGLTPTELFHAAAALSELTVLAGVDIVEVAPNLDATERTPMLAVEFLTQILGDRLFVRRPVTVT